MQGYLQKIFYNHETKAFRYTNDFFAFLTIVSIAGIVLETVAGLKKYQEAFLILEYVTVFFFVLEYFGRIVATKQSVKYIFSFFGVIDLVAILPTLMGFGNFTFLKSVRILRIVRFLRMLRLAKIARVDMTGDDHDNHGKDGFFTPIMQIYFMTLFAVIIIGGSLIWFFEASRDVFANIPLAMIWSTKVLFGGAPQAMPETIGGEFVVIFLRFIGLILFGLLINIVGGSAKQLLFGTQKNTS